MEMQMMLAQLPMPITTEYICPNESYEEAPKVKKVCITPLSKREPALKASREIRNLQTIQQSILIALLTQICDVTIKQPARKSVVTQQFMRMKSLDFGDAEVIMINEYLKRRCVEMKNDDIASGVSEKTATRRYQNNKRIELLHLLIDVLMIEGGYEFESRNIEGKAKLNKQEVIKKVILDGKIILDEKQLLKKGEEINTILQARLYSFKGDLVLKKGDSIASVLLMD